MKLEEIAEAVSAGTETRRREFKSAGAWSDVALRAQVTRACMAMANTRDGGLIMVGMKPSMGRPGHHILDGLSQEQASSFDPDVVIPQVNRHVSPHLEMTISHQLLEGGCRVVLFEVAQFADYPILCVRDVIGDGNRPLTSAGRILVRSRRAIESTELQHPEDVRELVDAAVDRGIANYFRRRRIEDAYSGPDDVQMFQRELGDLAR
jgi:hypothetical protein